MHVVCAAHFALRLEFGGRCTGEFRRLVLLGFHARIARARTATSALQSQCSRCVFAQDNVVPLSREISLREQSIINAYWKHRRIPCCVLP